MHAFIMYAKNANYIDETFRLTRWQIGWLVIVFAIVSLLRRSIHNNAAQAHGYQRFQNVMDDVGYAWHKAAWDACAPVHEY